MFDLNITGHFFHMFQEKIISICATIQIAATNMKHFIASNMNVLKIMATLLVKTNHLIDNVLDQFIERIRFAWTNGGRKAINLTKKSEFR